jgi:hypothetical protein
MNLASTNPCVIYVRETIVAIWCLQSLLFELGTLPSTFPSSFFLSSHSCHPFTNDLSVATFINCGSSRGKRIRLEWSLSILRNVAIARVGMVVVFVEEVDWRRAT